MKCPICKKDLNKGISKARRNVKGKKIVFINVPAWICPDNIVCDNVMFDSLDIERIEKHESKIVSNEIELKEVYDFSELI
jgi:YgiT-type zinc finger domain-containing protein